MNIIRKNNITISGRGDKTLLFAHGYGCDQAVWKYLTPVFSPDYQVVVFDHIGSGKSDLSAYNRMKYGTLHGYADDIVSICKTLELHNVTFVGHSVSAMMGALASIKQPDLFADMVFLAPSPCFINEDTYHGGFDRTVMNEMIQSLESNFKEWSQVMAPLIVGRAADDAISKELLASFCRQKPEVAKHFAQVAFFSDYRSEMKKIPVKTLILQCREDLLAPIAVGDFLQAQIPRNHLIKMRSRGHCPHMEAPEETIECLKNWFIKQCD